MSLRARNCAGHIPHCCGGMLNTAVKPIKGMGLVPVPFLYIIDKYPALK